METEYVELFKKRLKEKSGHKSILVGESKAMNAVLEKISLIAESDVTVLISGETGTGKELCAKAIHYLSSRAGKPFIPVNAGALPDTLFENELFGHHEGAYTDAKNYHPGLIKEAEGGTLFLDEIDTLCQGSQVKLLRLLEEGEYRSLGSTKYKKSDVRIIAATNANLEKKVESGEFRKDLFYRLNIINLPLPPLRERKEDIPLLTDHYFKKYTKENHRQLKEISNDAMIELSSYDWPGNVRELQNALKRLVVLTNGNNKITSADVRKYNGFKNRPKEINAFKKAKAKAIEEFEKGYITRILIAHHGNITHAAREAQKDRKSFWSLMKKHNISCDYLRTRDSMVFS